MDYKSNTDNHTQTNSTINVQQESSESYDDVHHREESALRSLNRETSIKSEIEEQRRRQSDIEGEERRRATASKVSNMFHLERKTHRNSIPSAVKDALKKAGSQIAISAVQAKSSTQTAGKKGWSVLRSKLDEASKLATKDKLDHAVTEARIGLANSTLHITKFAENVSEKSTKIAFEATNRGSALVVRGKTGLDLVLHHARIILRDISVKFSGWVQRTWSRAVYRAHLNHSTHLEEQEKRRRTLSDAEESVSIMNAIKVASLIKNLSPELYRPAEEPSGHYTLELLESKERNRRMKEDKLDKNLRLRFKHLSDLVMAYHNDKYATKELTPVYTIESIIPAPVKQSDPMQIFEEPRHPSELAGVAVSSPPPKIFQDYVTPDESPKSILAAM